MRKECGDKRQIQIWAGQSAVRQRHKRVWKKREGDIRQAVDMTLLIKGLSAYPHCLWYMVFTHVSILRKPQSTYRGRGKIGEVYLPCTQLECTPQLLLVLVDSVKGGWRAPTGLTSLG